MGNDIENEVVKWMLKKYNSQKTPLSYDVLKEAMKIFDINFEEAYSCKLSSFKKVLGIRN